MSDPFAWQCRTRRLEVGRRPLIMGVVNITPDSFSDGGRFFDHGSAVARGLQLLEDGADLLDVGGESSRPGAEPVSEAEELRRAIPVIEALRRRTDRVLSIDTAKPAVARAAMEAGADMVNDITALADPDMVGVIRSYDAGLILMHMQGIPRTMQENPHYEDVVGEVAAFLEERMAAALRGGHWARTDRRGPGNRVWQKDGAQLRPAPWIASAFPIGPPDRRGGFTQAIFGRTDRPEASG